MDVLDLLSQLGVQFKFLGIHAQARHTTAAAAAYGGPSRSVGGGEVTHPAYALVCVSVYVNVGRWDLEDTGTPTPPFLSPGEGKGNWQGRASHSPRRSHVQYIQRPGLIPIHVHSHLLQHLLVVLDHRLHCRLVNVLDQLKGGREGGREGRRRKCAHYFFMPSGSPILQRLRVSALTPSFPPSLPPSLPLHLGQVIEKPIIRLIQPSEIRFLVRRVRVWP